MAVKFAFVPEATAFAGSVFPVRGGPWRRPPFGASTPSRSNSSGWRSGSSIISRTFETSSRSPPMSSYATRGTFVSTSLAGFSVTFTFVEVETSTASAVGENPWTTNSNRRPMTGTDTRSPRVTTRPSRAWARYSSPPMIRIGSVGARVTFAAGFAATARSPTFSSSPIWAFLRWKPSSRTAPRFASSGNPGAANAAVFLRPSTITGSPSRRWRGAISSGSIRTIPRPTSWDFASRTLRNFSSSFMVVSRCESQRRKKEEGGGGLLDLHLDRLRGGRRLPLREADLENAVLQLGDDLLRVDLRGQRDGADECRVVPLAEEVVLVLPLTLGLRFGSGLDALPGHL